MPTESARNISINLQKLLNILLFALLIAFAHALKIEPPINPAKQAPTNTRKGESVKANKPPPITINNSDPNTHIILSMTSPYKNQFN